MLCSCILWWSRSLAGFPFFRVLGMALSFTDRANGGVSMDTVITRKTCFHWWAFRPRDQREHCCWCFRWITERRRWHHRAFHFAWTWYDGRTWNGRKFSLSFKCMLFWVMDGRWLFAVKTNQTFFRNLWVYLVLLTYLYTECVFNRMSSRINREDLERTCWQSHFLFRKYLNWFYGYWLNHPEMLNGL